MKGGVSFLFSFQFFTRLAAVLAEEVAAAKAGVLFLRLIHYRGLIFLNHVRLFPASYLFFDLFFIRRNSFADGGSALR